MAYLYRHIRLDKNEVFYVGIGSNKQGYQRAYAKTNRSKHWKNIVAKTNYEVEIFLDDLPREEAIVKEKEFIALYGRKCDGGTLCNLTIGGEGSEGIIGELHHNYRKPISEDQKKKISKSRSGIPPWNTGRQWSEEVKRKFRLSHKGKHRGNSNKQAAAVIHTPSGKEFESIMYAWEWAKEQGLFQYGYKAFHYQVRGWNKNKTEFKIK